MVTLRATPFSGLMIDSMNRMGVREVIVKGALIEDTRVSSSLAWISVIEGIKTKLLWIARTRDSTTVEGYASVNEIFSCERNGMVCKDANGMESTNTLYSIFELTCILDSSLLMFLMHLQSWEKNHWNEE